MSFIITDGLLNFLIRAYVFNENGDEVGKVRFNSLNHVDTKHFTRVSNFTTWKHKLNTCFKFQAYERVELLSPQPDWSEIDPDDLWAKVQTVIKGAVRG